MWGKKLRLAIRDAIQTEKDAMDYYQLASGRMVNEHARLTFQIFAKEERQHALSFYRLYRWNDIPAFEDLMTEPVNRNSTWWQASQKIALGDFDERQALEEAIAQEMLLENQLRATAELIKEPNIRQVYLNNASMTHHHLELIQKDYQTLQKASG